MSENSVPELLEELEKTAFQLRESIDFFMSEWYSSPHQDCDVYSAQLPNGEYILSSKLAALAQAQAAQANLLVHYENNKTHIVVNQPKLFE